MTFYTINEKIIFFIIPVILFSLLPFFLITGPFLSDLSIVIISLLFLIYCFKKRDFSYFNNIYFHFFLIFWVYLIFNSLVNNFNLGSLKISLFYFRYGVFVIAVVALLSFDQKFLKYFFYCIFICFIALIIDGFYQYFIGENILGWKRTHRTSSFFGDEKILGSYLCRMWPIFFGLYTFFFKKKNNFFWFFVITFVLSEVLIFLSGDRIAFFYINLSAGFVIIFSKKLLKLRLLTLLSSIVLILIISLINPIAKERIFDHTLKQMNLVDRNIEDGVYIFSKNHNSHYITAYRMFLDNKILGVGVKNFRNYCDYEKYIENELSCSTHPHNTYIQTLSEIGIIGFMFLMISLLYFLKYIIQHLRLKLKGQYFFNDFEICILSGIIIFLWPFAPTGNVFNNWLSIITILNLPLLIWSLNLKYKT